MTKVLTNQSCTVRGSIETRSQKNDSLYNLKTVAVALKLKTKHFREVELSKHSANVALSKQSKPATSIYRTSQQKSTHQDNIFVSGL